MKNNAITAIALRNVKPRDKQYRIVDGQGLSLIVHPTGRMVWSVSYMRERKQCSLTLGQYPELGLAEARRQAQETRACVAKGADPKERPGYPLSQLLTDLHERKKDAGRAQATLDRDRVVLGHLSDELLATDIASLTTRLLSESLTTLTKNQGAETAYRVAYLFGQACRLACQRGLRETDPSSALRGLIKAPTTEGFAAITDELELGKLMAAIKGYSGMRTTATGLAVLALTAARPGEIRWTKWDDVDLKAATIRLDASRTKTRTERKLYLSKQAVDLIDGLNRKGEFVFPALTGTLRPLSENTMSQALKRLGYSEREHTCHGFRKTFSTLANRSKLFRADAIEAALGHVQGGTRGIYNLEEYEKEQRDLVQWWADRLDALTATAIAFS